MHEAAPNAGRSPRTPVWIRWTFIVSLLAPVAFLALVMSSRAIAWALGEIYAVIGAMGWLVVGVIAVMFVVDFIRSRRHERDKSTSLRSKGRPRRLATFALLTLVAGSQLCLNVAAGRLDRHWEQRKRDGLDVYKNHDLARLVGECVRLSLLRHRESVGDHAVKTVLGRIAGAAPQRWNALTNENDPRVASLADANLLAFVREPDARALNTETWSELLRDFEVSAGAALSDDDRSAAAATVSADFGVTLREALKADFTRGGQAWAAMQLDIAQSLLEREVRGADHRDPETSDALREAIALLADVDSRLPEISDLLREVRLTQDDYARSVLDRFDQLELVMRELVGEVLTEIGELRDQTDALYQIELVKADPSLSDEEKFDRILALGEPSAGNVDEEPEPIDLPPELRRFIEQMAANASLLDKHRASVLLGDFAEADRLAEAYETERRAQREAEDYLWFVSRGDRYWSDRQYDVAGVWFRRAIELRSTDPKLLRKGALSLVRTRRSSTYGKSLAVAERWLGLSVEIEQSSEEMDDAGVAASLNNHAGVLQMLGRAGEAEPLFRRAIEIYVRHYGSDVDDPAIATSLNNLAGVCDELGKVAEAERLYQQSLAMRRRVYGADADHPDIAASLGNLAGVRSDLGQLDEAEQLYSEALDVYRRSYREDPDHHEIAVGLNNLAIHRLKLGRVLEAEPLFREALEMRRRLFGNETDHPSIAFSLSSLAGLKRHLGQAGEAEALSLEALEMRQRLYGADTDHPEIAASLSGVASARMELGRADQAEPLYERALEMHRRLYRGDADHSEIATGLSNLANARVRLGRAGEAEPLHEEALSIRRRLYGENADHPDIASSLNSLGYLRQKLGRGAEAEALLEEVLEMRRRIYGPNADHPEIVNSLDNLAYVRKSQGRIEESEPLYEESLAMNRRLLEPETDHPKIALGLSELATARLLLGRTRNALSLFEEAADVAGRCMAEGDPLRSQYEAIAAALRQRLGESSSADPEPDDGG